MCLVSRNTAIGSELGAPSYAPAAVRILKPVTWHDWTAPDRAFPSQDTFSAATPRALTGADGKTLTEFDIDMLRRRDGFGALIEPSRTRLTGPPTDLGDTSYFTVTGSSTLFSEGTYGSFNKLRVEGANATSFIQSSSFPATNGTSYSKKLLLGKGSSAALRSRLRSASTNLYSEIRGGWNEAIITSETLGALTNLRHRLYDGELTELVYTTLANSNQADIRAYIGPNDAATLYAYGMQVVAEPHAGEWITVAGGVTGADLLTRNVAGAGLRAMQVAFVLNGWKAGETETVILQLDNGNDTDRMALIVDTASLALKAIYEVDGSRIAELTLGTLTLGTEACAGMAWGDSSYLAQMDGNASQTGPAGGAIPAFTRMRMGCAMAGGEAYLRAINRGTYALVPSAVQLTQALAAAAYP